MVHDGMAVGATGEATRFNSIEVSVQQCLPAIERWAHGRMPRSLRGRCEAVDLVQEAAMRMLAQQGRFAPQHSGAVPAYLRSIVLNLMRDQLRQHARRRPADFDEDLPCQRTGPLQLAIRQDLRRHYTNALRELTPKDQQLVSARMEGRSLQEIAGLFGLASVGAAGMAVRRAVRRLVARLEHVRR